MDIQSIINPPVSNPVVLICADCYHVSKPTRIMGTGTSALWVLSFIFFLCIPVIGWVIAIIMAIGMGSEGKELITQTQRKEEG